MKKTIALTGISGFVGSHLACQLLKDGWEVHAWVRRSLPNRAPLATADRSQLTLHELGQSPEERMMSFTEVLMEHKPQAVIHLVTHFVGVHQSSDLPKLADSNVLFGMQLLEAIQQQAPKTRFILAGTAWQHFESAAYDPVSLYAATKQAFEDILKYYQNVGKIEAVILKLFDAYGPHDYRGKLFHMLRTAAKSQQNLAFSPGEQWIDLIYIDDVVQAFVHALDPEVRQGEYVVSSGQPVRLKELIQIYQKTTGKTVPVEFGARPYRPREMMTPWKIGNRLPGWNPQISLEQGICLMENEL